MDPTKPPMKVKGNEVVRSIGGFWIVAESKGDMMGKPFLGVMTLGFDPQTKKYTGTWSDSMASHLWKYEELSIQPEDPDPGKLRAMPNEARAYEVSGSHGMEEQGRTRFHIVVSR
jgi:hypothetical protein